MHQKMLRLGVASKQRWLAGGRILGDGDHPTSLLREAQRNEIFEAIEEAGLNPSAGACLSSGLVLPRTGKPDRWHPRSRCLLHGGSR